MKKVFYVSFLFLVLLSCEKEKDNIIEDYQSETLIRQIGETEEFMQIFTYYNTRNIYEYLQRFTYRKYIYNNREQLEKIEIAQSFNPLSCAIIPGTSFADGDDPRNAPIGHYIEFEYTTDNKIKRRSHYFMVEEKSELMSYEVFDYDDNFVTRINIFNIQDELTQFHDFEYDMSGNVSVEDYYFYSVDSINATLASRREFEYDNKLNPFQVFDVEGFPGRGTNPNNITKEITSYFYNNEQDSYSTEYNYEYNALGFPVLVNDVEYIYGEDE